jgi:hypothetical protein
MDKATDAMLSAIELYNKPNFPYREEAFAILAVNAWELLLKARLMLLSNNKVAAILAYERRSNSDGTTSIKWYRKKNRSGNYLTVGLFEAYDRLTNDLSDTLHASLRANLEALVEVRDNSVHYYNR